MDQVKEFLRQCVIYRFWISVATAALFALIAYFVGAGPVQLKAETETKNITQASKDVEPFKAPGVPNDDYRKAVDEKTAVLNKDVDTAWRELYNRQKPLLKWPDVVENRFREWGRKWPEKVADGAVTFAIVDYISAYPAYVESVYKIINPFDYETGKGVIAAPPKEQLLQPSPFDINSPPDLGKVWAAQERLWVQRSALEVVAQVNKDAKDWDTAIIKQINFLDVGSAGAQDQQSQAKGQTLTEAEAITAPGEEAASEESTSASSGPMGGAYGGMGMREMMGGRGMMGAGGSTAAPETISFIKPESGSYKILPVLLSVLIDQDHIQDLLCELENSPMAIQVKDFTLERPSARVTKPEKGETGMMGGMMGGYYGRAGEEGMMRGMMGMGGGRGMMGYGGMASQMSNMMRSMGGMGGPMGMSYGGMGGMGGGAPARTGTDKRTEDKAKKREEAKKAVETSKGLSLFDPYYNIVELKVYGQARFYDAPPAEVPPDPSLGDQAVSETPAEAAKPAEAPKADAAKPADAPKADAAKPADAPKADAAKPAEPAKPAEAPKVEAPKADAAKPADAPKAQEPAKAPEPAKEKAPGA
ncbi:hypothetical protein [Aquisphaera insulae]|uniref:hypothetical protein n=1 Tax=Aquisphaera insulae TaxID=2712864 RepID=UPI0013E9BE53|nr:hypothetical protein [Aquisphaera insulae]